MMTDTSINRAHADVRFLDDVARFPRPFAVTIMNHSASVCRVRPVALKGDRRFKHLVEARAVAVWSICGFRPDLSYAQIGREMGGRDHSTIINLRRKAGILIPRNPEFALLCLAVRREFESRGYKWLA